MTPKNKPMLLLVMGMHRSGTSLLTNIIYNAGYYVGEEEDLLPPSPFNPKGYFERRSIMEANDLILGSALGSWDSPPAFENIKKVCVDPLLHDLLQPYLQHERSVLKDPRFAFTLPVWEKALENSFSMKYILITRDDSAVNASLRKRNGFNSEKAQELIDAYKLALRTVLEPKKIFELDFDDLFSEKRVDILGGLADFIEYDGDLKQAADEAVENDLRHYSSRQGTEDNKNETGIKSNDKIEEIPDNIQQSTIGDRSPAERVSEKLSSNPKVHQSYDLQIFPESSRSDRKLKVLVITHNCGAVSQVRLLSPLKVLGEKKLIEYRIKTINTGSTITQNDFKDVDIIVFQRIDANPLLEVLYFAKKRGITTVYEIDDNLLELPPENPNYDHYRSKIIRNTIIEFIENVDHVTVTTTTLKNYFSPYNPAITILPNQIDEDIFHHHAPVLPKPFIRIGFAGTVTHQKDFQQVIPALQRIADEYRDRVQLVFLNFLPEEFQNDPRIEFIPGIDDLPRFARLFDGASLDIGLAPLHFDEFNRGKSDVKFLEYAALNIAGIYSDFTPYKNVVVDGKTGFLVKSEDPEEWYDKIRSLIESPEKIDEIKEMAAQFVKYQRTFSRRAMDWYNLYNEISAGKKKKVTIIIPVYDQYEFTVNCLKSIYRYTESEDFDLIVVNNGSGEKLSSWLEIQSRIHENMRMIHNERNLGFAAANNQAASIAASPYLLLLNNDIEVSENWLQPLLDVMDKDNSISAVGPRLEFPDGKIQHAGVVYVENRMKGGRLEAWHVDYKKEPKPENALMREFQALTAACLLVRKSSFDKAGGFDEAYWNGYEDVHLCATLQRDGGKCVYQPDSVLIHYESRSGKERFSKESENLKRFNQLWKNDIVADFILESDGKITDNRSGRIKDYQIPSASSKSKKKREGRSVIIVTYNSADTIEKCLFSVIRNLNFRDEIIVLDNSSSDKTKDILKAAAKKNNKYNVIFSRENLGFSEGVNRALKVSSGEYIILLNPDTLVSHDWLDRMEEYFNKDKMLAAVGPVSNYAAGMQNMDHYVKKNISHLDNVDKISEKFSEWYSGQSEETPLLTGFCMMIRYDVLEKVGFLDPELFLGNDDLDLSWRFRLQGYKLKVAKDVFIYHEGQHSFKKAGSEVTDLLVQQSSDRLYKKLQDYYGADSVPTPEKLWGINWFRPSNPKFNKNTEPFPLVSIVMLTFNALEWTKKAVDSILENTKHAYELIFVDNGSSDETKTYLKELTRKHEHISYIRNSRNMGFARGNNQGAKIASGKYLLFLNNDVLVSDGWLANLVRGLEQDPKIGLIGPMTNSISGRQSFTKIRYKDEDGFYEFAQFVRTANRGKITPRRRIAGFAMLMKKSVFDEVGGFDESFGTGNFEDDDLCLRVRDLGYAIMVDESTFIHHYGSQTFKANKIDYNKNIKERMRLFRKKWPDVDYSELLEINRSLQQDHCDELKTADKYIEQEDIDKAAPIYQKVFRENPLSHDAMYGLSLVDYARGNYTQGLNRLKQLLQRDSTYGKAYNLLGLICYSNSKYNQAETFFHKAIELNPDNLDAHQNIVEAFFSQEKYTEAEQKLRQNIERFPDHVHSSFRLAQLYAGKGLTDKAIELLEKVRETNPRNKDITEFLKMLQDREVELV